MPTVAYRAIRSRRAFVNAPRARRVLDDTLDNTVKPYLIQQFNYRVANWKHKPNFKARKFVNRDETKVTVFPSGPSFPKRRPWQLQSQDRPRRKVRRSWDRSRRQDGKGAASATPWL